MSLVNSNGAIDIALGHNIKMQYMNYFIFLTIFMGVLLPPSLHQAWSVALGFIMSEGTLYYITQNAHLHQQVIAKYIISN